MTQPILIGVADAITRELNTGAASADFVLPFRAERSYADWDEQLRDMDVLHVDVVPVDHSPLVSSLVSRSDYEYFINTDIGVRYRFSKEGHDDESGRVELCQVDRLVLLLEQISEFFTPHQLEDMPGWVWTQTEIRAGFIRPHLRELRQYTGLVRLTHHKDKTV